MVDVCCVFSRFIFIWLGVFLESLGYTTLRARTYIPWNRIVHAWISMCKCSIPSVWAGVIPRGLLSDQLSTWPWRTYFDIIKGRLYKRNIYALYASTQANDRWWPAVYLMLSQLNLQFTVYPLPTVTTKINIYHVIILTPSLSKLFPGCLTSSLLKHRTCPSSIHAGCYTSRKHRIWYVFSQLCTSWSLSLTWSPCGILCTPRYQQLLCTWLVVYSKTAPVELTMCETCIVGG